MTQDKSQSSKPIFIIALTALALAACGGGTSENPTTTAAADPATTSPSSTPSPSPTPSPTTTPSPTPAPASIIYTLNSASGVTTSTPKDTSTSVTVNSGDRITITSSNGMLGNSGWTRVSGACTTLNTTFGYPFSVTFMAGPCVMKVSIFFGSAPGAGVPETAFVVTVN